LTNEKIKLKQNLKIKVTENENLIFDLRKVKQEKAQTEEEFEIKEMALM
jgi:hypothetical protein